MITFVYCCICLLIAYCQTVVVETEDYTNDSPDILPKVEFLRHKIGSDILLKCNDHHHNNKEKILWEFKHCESNYKGVQCNKYNMYSPNLNEEEWKKLDFGRARKRLEIKNSSVENSGLYRCLYEDLVVKIYIVEVVAPARYRGPPPEVLSLTPTNSTVAPNSHLVILCKATSTMPPEIRWFKECNGRRCDVRENDHCYCSIASQNSIYSTGNDIYLSKLNIYNARSVDSGVYACLVISLYGKDYKSVAIKVNGSHDDDVHKSFSLLFLIPLAFILVPVIVWMCYYRRKKKHVKAPSEHQKQLIKPVVTVDIVLEGNEIV